MYCSIIIIGFRFFDTAWGFSSWMQVKFDLDCIQLAVNVAHGFLNLNSGANPCFLLHISMVWPFLATMSACLSIIWVLSSCRTVLYTVHHIAHNQLFFLILSWSLTINLILVALESYLSCWKIMEKTSFKLGKGFIMQIWDFKFENWLANLSRNRGFWSILFVSWL